MLFRVKYLMHPEGSNEAKILSYPASETPVQLMAPGIISYIHYELLESISRLEIVEFQHF